MSKRQRLWLWLKTSYYRARTLRRELANTFVALAVILAAALWMTSSSSNRDLILLKVLGTLGALLVAATVGSQKDDAHYFPLVRDKETVGWSGVGVFEYDELNKCHRVMNCPDGRLLPETYSWTNYRARFRFKIGNGCFGVVFRAADLANYAMVQIGTDRVVPHVKDRGQFHAAPHQYTGPILPISSPLSKDEWHVASISCKDRDFRIQITDHRGRIVFDQPWRLPDPQGFVMVGPNPPGAVVGPPTLSLDHGAFGFRCAPGGDGGQGEVGLIRDLFVGKL